MRALPITLCSTLRSLFARWRCRSASAPDLATGGDAGGRLAGSVGGTGRNQLGVVGLSPDDPVWDPTVFTKNRDRLQNGEVFAKFMTKLLNHPQVKPLLSD